MISSPRQPEQNPVLQTLRKAGQRGIFYNFFYSINKLRSAPFLLPLDGVDSAFCDIPDIWISSQEQENDNLF